MEELICLAVWREGSTRYMVGRVLQQDRRSSHPTDEEQYRCFIYERVNHQMNGYHSGITYNIAQSGDASCTGLQNANEGSKTIKLTTGTLTPILYFLHRANFISVLVDDHHNRCRFPIWLTEHHTWHSLDHRLSYQFSQRNATLKVKKDTSYNSGSSSSSSLPYGMGSLPYTDDNEENSGAYHNNLHAAHLAGDGHTVRLICHSILQSLEKKKVQIVAHVTAGW